MRRYGRAHDCALVELGRKQFDDTVGADLVSQCARPGSRLVGRHAAFPSHLFTSEIERDTAACTRRDHVIQLDSCPFRRLNHSPGTRIWPSRLAANPRDMYLAFGAAAAVLQFVECGTGGGSFGGLAQGYVGGGGGGAEPFSSGRPCWITSVAQFATSISLVVYRVTCRRVSITSIRHVVNARDLH